MAVELPENVLITSLDRLASWCRKNSLWPMPFATACCGIELMATAASRYDIARFGSEAMRVSVRRVTPSVVASAATTILALLGLVLASVGLVSGLGPVNAIGLVVGGIGLGFLRAGARLLLATTAALLLGAVSSGARGRKC